MKLSDYLRKDMLNILLPVVVIYMEKSEVLTVKIIIKQKQKFSKKEPWKKVSQKRRY